MSLYDTARLKALDGNVYEQCEDEVLSSGMSDHKYRVIIENCDYDYVEDEVIIKELDRIKFL